MVAALRPRRTSCWTNRTSSRNPHHVALPCFACRFFACRCHRCADLRRGESLAHRRDSRENAGRVLWLRNRRRRRARAISEGAGVSAAARGADGSREVSGARQDDDGECVFAGDDQLTSEFEEAGSADRDQSPPRRSARAERRGGRSARARGEAVLPAVCDDSLDGSRQRPIDPADRPSPRHRHEPRNPRHARQRRRLARAVTKP